MKRKHLLIFLIIFLSLSFSPVCARQKVVVINPGHTVGLDPGACGKSIREAELNQDVACRLEGELTSRGYKVYLTHCSRPEYADKTLTSVETADTLRNLKPIINNVHPDLVMSVHHNSGGSSSTGYQIYWSSYRDFDKQGVYSVNGLWANSEAFRDNSPCYVARESQRLANIVHSCMSGKPRIGFSGIYERDDYIPAHVFAPSILFEGGYLSNPSEEAYMGTDEYKNDMAVRLANSIDEYFRQAPIPTGIHAAQEVTNLIVGDTGHLKVVPEPEGYPNSEITIDNPDSDVCHVDPDGTITAKAEGSVVITFHPADNPNVYGLARITVHQRTPYTIQYSCRTKYNGIVAAANGNVGGSVGQGDPIFTLSASLIHTDGSAVNPNELGIRYRSHVANIGWTDYVANGAPTGTTDQELALEGLQFELTGSESQNYDIFYRSHCSNFGWCAYTANNNLSGSEGFASNIEAVELLILPKGKAPDTSGVDFYTAYGAGLIRYDTSVRELGYSNFSADGQVNGAEGLGLGIEAIRVIGVAYLPSGSITGSAHVSDLGWKGNDGMLFGTIGQNRYLEAYRMNLTGELANQYDINYQACVRNQGWGPEVKNGEMAGTEGLGLPLDAVKIWLTPKN